MKIKTAILFLALCITMGVSAQQTDKTFTVKGVSFVMKSVAGGTFQMGATSEHWGEEEDREKPYHSVTLSSYYIGKTEVTQALWETVMGSNPSIFKGNNLPVEQVSWEDCQTFITKLNQLTGQKFRLPTEAEWEYAARGGKNSKGYKYSGSNTADNVMWYKENSGSKTHPVATKQPNELGLYDMSGNVWEWCQDGFYWYKKSSSPIVDPTGPTSGSSRMYRGGSWRWKAEWNRSSYRDCGPTSSRDIDLGLRLALSQTTSTSTSTPKATTTGKPQQKFLDEAEKYINTDNGKTPNVAAARQALNSAGGEGTAEYEIVAGDVEKIAYKDAYIKNDETALAPAGLAAFDHYKKAYALALNKKPDIVKRAQEGALFVLEMTSGMVTVGMTYAAKQEFRKALEAWHTALTAVKEPVLTSNPQAQNAIKQYSEDVFVDMLIRNCIGIAYHSLEDKEAVKELEFLKPRARGMEMKSTVCQALALRYYVVDNQSAYEAVLKEGFDKFPDEPWFVIQLVSLYMSKKDYAAANQFLDKAIARDPNNDDSYRTKGVFLQEQGKKAEALTYYQKALKMNPNSVVNNYTMGWYYFSEEDVDKALLYYEKAYSLDTKHESTLVCNGLKGVYWIKSVNAGETTPEGKRWAEKRKKVMAEYGIKE